VAAALRISEGYLRLRQARSELADAERVADLGALAGGLAHEIKNPLLGLKLGIHLLRRESAQGDRLDRIADDVRRIDDLVTGLLRFTHDEMREDAAEALDLVAVVRDCVRELRPIAEDRETEVVEDYPLAPACVQGGRTQLRMVVSNLVRNAIDAAGESGVVQVAVEESPSSVSICVSDDGPGIPSHLRERIFDLAFSTKPGGSGIGLALARREAERMGGSIAVDEVPSGGTRFVVRLPAAAREAALAAD
jgi:signal transduction histidine kinase